MLNNIFDFLDKIGFASQKRALHIYFANPEINSQVFLQRIDSFHAINEGLSAELICLSTNPYISLKQFIGCQVAIEQVTDSGKLFRTTGIITGASQGQSDGALCLYKLTMQDATSLWHKRRNSRVFMNESRRSASGEERDKKTAEQKVTCSAPKQEIPQTQFIDAYEQAQQTDNFLNAS